MNNKGQGAFEYILLLAGILLIVVLVIVILKSSILTNANTNVAQSSTTITHQTNSTLCNSKNNITQCLNQ